MPKRFTDSEKWEDPWFRKLPPNGKLMILYLYDKCDIAGFWEIDLEAAAFKIGISQKETLEAIKGLERAYETNGDYIWIKRFVRFQGNKDLNENNKAHLGIIRLLKAREGFSENVSRVLNGIDLPSPYEGASMGLLSLTSTSKGIGTGKGIEVPNDTNEDFTATDSVIDYLNTKASSSFRHSDASRKNIHARLTDGLTVEDCQLVVDFKCSEWLGDTEWEKYLTPETLFRPTKIENNLNAAQRWEAKGRPAKNGDGNKSLQIAGGREAEYYENAWKKRKEANDED